MHVAIIMDGNGRWARERGWPRSRGHRAGADAVRRVVEAAPDLGIKTLTLYAFSSDNWTRPAREVETLMRLFQHFLESETDACRKQGVRLHVIGRRDRLVPELVRAISLAEQETAHGQTIDLRLAVDYSARDAILRAAAASRAAALSRDDFRLMLAHAMNENATTPDVDLLIRTGREQRLSDFLLWECAYAELLFTERLWPDFDSDDLHQPLDEFHRRDRRFGSLPANRKETTLGASRGAS